MFWPVLFGVCFPWWTLTMRSCMYMWNIFDVSSTIKHSAACWITLLNRLWWIRYHIICKTLRTKWVQIGWGQGLIHHVQFASWMSLQTLHTFSDPSNKETRISFYSRSAAVFVASSGSHLPFQGCIQVSMTTISNGAWTLFLEPFHGEKSVFLLLFDVWN